MEIRADTAEGFDEALFASAIGPNRDYYLPRFRRFARGAWISWNWSAFFATLAWLQYRKLNGWAWLYVFASLPFLVWWLPADRPATCIGEGGVDVAAVVVALVAVAMLIVPPLAADRLYFAHIRGLVKKSAPDDLPKKGGTASYAAPLVVQAVAFVLGLLAYPDMAFYVTRSKITEGVFFVVTAAGDVQQYQRQHAGQLPARLEDATKATSGLNVDRVELAPDGTIRATFSKSAGILAGRSVSMVAGGKSDGVTMYRCVSENLVDRCLPKQCRGR